MGRGGGERVIGSQLAGLVVPYAQELRDLGVDETLLRELAELTGGAALEKPHDAFLKARRRSRISVEIWPWLVVAAAGRPTPGIPPRPARPGAVPPPRGPPPPPGRPQAGPRVGGAGGRSRAGPPCLRRG